MSEYVVSRAAKDDLDAIWAYIAEDSVYAAERWIEKLIDEIESLAQNPGIGHRREDLTHLPVRFWAVGDYLIVYKVRSAEIEIVAVTQGSRDIPKLLRARV